MKQILLVCCLFAGLASFGQPGEKIEGNGNIKKETRKADAYTAISASGSMEVQVLYGNSNTVEVEADENLLPYIITEVKNGELTIKTKNLVNINTTRKIVIYATTTRITALQLSGSGSIKGDGNFSNDGATDVRLSGSGHINLSFNKTSALHVAISGSGNVKIEGSAGSVEASISGSGNVDCSDVVCDDASARISGSGNLRIFANKSINASVSGSGNVYYKGPASDIKKRTSGSGKIIKIA